MATVHAIREAGQVRGGLVSAAERSGLGRRGVNANPAMIGKLAFYDEVSGFEDDWLNDRGYDPSDSDPDRWEKRKQKWKNLGKAIRELFE